MCRVVWIVSWLFVLSVATSADAVQLQHPNRAALVMQNIDKNKPNKIYEGVVRWSDKVEDRLTHVIAGVDIGYFEGPITIDFSPNVNPSEPFALIVGVNVSNVKQNDGIDRLGVLQARTDTQQTGVMLAGNVLQGEDSRFIGITEGDVNTNNFDLLLNDNWLEIPILFRSGLQGKITFEKGFAGQKEITKLIETLKASR